MPSVQKRTISLPSDQAAFIDSKVKSGDYASASEVVRAGLRALRDRDEAVEQWLRDTVAASYDAMKADPERGVPVDAAFDAIRDRHAARTKDRG